MKPHTFTFFDRPARALRGWLHGDQPRSGPRTSPALAAAALALAVTFVPFGSSTWGPGAVSAAEPPRVLPSLLSEAGKHPDQSYRVIVQRKNKDKNADSYAAGKGYKKLKDVAADAFVVEVKGKDLADLGRQPAVKYVSPDAHMVHTGGVDTSKLGTVYTQAINAAGLVSSSGSGSGLTGAGIGVAVVDTGIQDGLNDFKTGTGASTKRIAANVLFNSSLKGTSDGHGHGTHVAGIIAGNSWYSGNTAVQGKYVGVAPEAKLIDVRVSDDQGMAYASDVVNAIDWVIQNRTTYNIRVMNLSLRSSVAESYKTSTLDAAVERAWFNGIFVVVAAGNDGVNTALYPPANDPFVVTVGAADPAGTASRADDGMAPWSSYGLTQDGVSKPDVVAPGRYIASTLAGSNVTLARNFPDRVVDGSYIWMSGTSMSAPVVSGIAALAFQAHPGWTNDQLKWLLMNTATKLGGAVPLPGQGAGEVDAAKVVQYTGTPSAANQGLPISSQLVGPNGATSYTSSTWSESTWSSSTWSSSTWSSSTWSSSTWSSSTWSESTWSTASMQSAAVK